MLENTFMKKATFTLKRDVLPLIVVSHQDRSGYRCGQSSTPFQFSKTQRLSLASVAMHRSRFFTK